MHPTTTTMQSSLQQYTRTGDAPKTNTDDEPNTPDLTNNTGEINDADDIRDAVNDLLDAILNAPTEDDARDRVAAFLEQAAATGVGRYSFNNQIALIHQLHNRDEPYKNTAQHFAGFNTWLNEHERHVEKGETGFKILAPRTGPTCPDCGNAANYHANRPDLDCPRAGTDPSTWDINPREEWSEGVLYFTTATTFAFEQTAPNEDADPEDVFEPMRSDTVSTDADAEAVEVLFDTMRSAGENGDIPNVPPLTIEMAGSAALGRANGASAGGAVLIKKDRDTAAQVRTLVHELAHEHIHQGAAAGVPREVEEVEAEAIAYAVSSYFGLSPDGSDLYVGAWMEHARETGVAEDDENADGDATPRDVIGDRLETVQDAAAEIIEAIEKH